MAAQQNSTLKATKKVTLSKERRRPGNNAIE
jgi:hypothetical protein